MKKIFTILAVALCALTASAKQVLESTWNPWGETTTVDGSKISFSAAWAGAGFQLAGEEALDLSDFDYIVVKLAKCTGNANFAIEYTNDGSNSLTDANKVATNASGAAGAAIVGIPLSVDYSTNVIQMWVQATQANMEVEITEVYAGTEEEFLADKEANKQLTSDISLTGWGSWGNETHSNTAEGYLKIDFAAAWGGTNLWFGGFDASEFDYIVAEIEPTDVVTQLFVQYTNAPTEEGSVKDQTAQAQPGQTEISIPLYASAKNSIAQVAFQADNAGTVIVKKLYWKAASATGINEAIAAPKAQNNVRYNLAGQRVGKNAKMYIMNGKIYMK
ncbi:MAG: hypothetical protein ACI4TD_06320 [Phocaeicola sp.]